MARETRLRLRGLLAWFMAALAICAGGCSDAEPVAGLDPNEQRLVLPVTVSLATPHGVAATAPVLSAADGLRLGARSEVMTGTSVALGSAGVTAEPDALLNELWSRGTAALRDRVRVRGTLHARTRTLGNGVSIAAWDSSPALDPVSVLSWNVAYPETAASSVHLNAGQSKTLTPGRYASVSVSSQATLTLTSGTYYLSCLRLESQATVKLDQLDGPVIIYVKDSLTSRGTFKPLNAGPPDLLIGYLGQQDVTLETSFDGALLAPKAKLTLRAVSTPHTGFFYAKQLTLDAGAKVRYRKPLALVAAAGISGAACRGLLSGDVSDLELSSYCRNCVSDADTDRDGVEDCVDGCPSDPLKTEGGACGCGSSDTDGDGDGVPDCHDLCPADARNTAPGDCGCQGELDGAAPAPAGAPCSDPACPQTAPTCDGAGVCGQRAGCAPAEPCRLVSSRGTSYWLCPGPATRDAAAKACRDKQMALVRINSNYEARFLGQFVSQTSWIGANALSAAGSWRWSTASGENGDAFWSGGASGAQQNQLFSSWAPGSPGSNRCAVMRADGAWLDVPCTQGFAFICEAPPQLRNARPSTSPPGMAAPPPSPRTACVAESTVLPGKDERSVLEQQFAQAESGVYVGAFADPPSSSSCPDALGANGIGDGTPGHGCQFQLVSPAGHVCSSDAECGAFDDNALCRQVRDDPSCKPSETKVCSGRARCVILDCPKDDAEFCDQVEVCSPDSEFVLDDIDEDSNAEAAPFDPNQLFDEPRPSLEPSATYEDPPPSAPAGKDHPWCFLGVQQPLPAANQPESDKNAKSGGKSGIKFNFHPDLYFDADVNPLALGETDLSLRAGAELTASVQVSSLFGVPINPLTKDILKAVADIRAERCTISTDQSKFEVLGGKFFDTDQPFIFNTKKRFPEVTQACDEAVGKYVKYANRAKKAFRDAQQLLRQYHELKDGNFRFDELCPQLMSAVQASGVDVELFPGGMKCPANEPPEITINRFLDYYQAPGFGQIEQFREAIAELKDATDKLRKQLAIVRSFKIADFKRQESQTLVSVPFTIGPIPMLLEVDVFYAYGLSGAFELRAEFPFDPLNPEVGKRSEIAWVKAGVMPYANAGLSVFVGAGGGFGPIKGTLGIEGAVSLGEVKAPLFVGAGIGATVTKDLRPFPTDVRPPVAQLLGADQLLHFGVPTAFKFHVWYDYGLRLDVENVLAGELNAKLRIKFAFFSRTWRKRLLKLTGFSFHRDLLSGKLGSDPRVAMSTQTIDGLDAEDTSTPTVDGVTEVGFAESEAPLALLQPLEVDTTPSTTTLEVKPFDASEVEGLFYDQLCCVAPGQRCALPGERLEPGGPGECCPGSVCRAGAGGQGFCSGPVACLPQEQECSLDSECCPLAQHEVSCNPETGLCDRCGITTDDPQTSAPCGDDYDCCEQAGHDVSCGAASGKCERCSVASLDPAESGPCEQASDCCAEPADSRYRVSCGGSGKCERCGLASEFPASAAFCRNDSDCCGHDLPNSTIRCFDNACIRPIE